MKIHILTAALIVTSSFACKARSYNQESETTRLAVEDGYGFYVLYRVEGATDGKKKVVRTNCKDGSQPMTPEYCKDLEDWADYDIYAEKLQAIVGGDQASADERTNRIFVIDGELNAIKRALATTKEQDRKRELAKQIETLSAARSLLSKQNTTYDERAKVVAGIMKDMSENFTLLSTTKGILRMAFDAAVVGREPLQGDNFALGLAQQHGGQFTLTIANGTKFPEHFVLNKGQIIAREKLAHDYERLEFYKSNPDSCFFSWIKDGGLQEIKYTYDSFRPSKGGFMDCNIKTVGGVKRAFGSLATSLTFIRGNK